MNLQLCLNLKVHSGALVPGDDNEYTARAYAVSMVGSVALGMSCMAKAVENALMRART